MLIFVPNCFDFFFKVKSGKGPPNRATILLQALNDLLNTLFNNPADANLICAVKLLKVSDLNLLHLQIGIKSSPCSFIVWGGNENVFLNLQLTGSVLDDDWKEGGKPHMDELIQRIETILLDATCSRCVNHCGLTVAAVIQSLYLRQLRS